MSDPNIKSMAARTCFAPCPTCARWLCILVLMFGTMVAHAEEFPELQTGFTAEMNAVAAGIEMQGRLWVDGAKRRQETRTAEDLHHAIFRADTGYTYIWAEGDSSALRIEYDPAMAGLPARDALASHQLEFQGRETIADESVLRFDFKGTSPLGTPTEGTVWVTTDGIVVQAQESSSIEGEKIESEVQLINIQRGAQPNSLFELPDGLSVD